MDRALPKSQISALEKEIQDMTDGIVLGNTMELIGQTQKGKAVRVDTTFLIRPGSIDDCKEKEFLRELKIQNPFSLITKVKWIKWRLPPTNVLKLNVDGASKGKTGLSSGGVVVRNHEGRVILAAGCYFGLGSNMVLNNIPPKPPDIPQIPYITPHISPNPPTKSQIITNNFASLFKKPIYNKNVRIIPTGSVSFPSPFVNPLGCINSTHMPPPLPLHQNQSITNFTSPSLFPSTASTPANTQISSPAIGIQIPNVTPIIQITHDVNLPHSQTLFPAQGPMFQAGASSSQINQDVSIPPVSIPVGLFIFASFSKLAKTVVFNNGEPDMYWSPDETQEHSRSFKLTLIGKCAYGKPSLGVVKEFINTRWLLKGDFIVGVLDPRHILIRFSNYED
ncbi:unnamed protein product [Ilex paraguariensis]|uniref:DUF4283 domain-containing protein n=1 Tax=Ilex paraguariensis TaxID=185542 RepID=A0ABC8TDP7_9AQUA